MAVGQAISITIFRYDALNDVINFCYVHITAQDSEDTSIIDVTNRIP